MISSRYAPVPPFFSDDFVVFEQLACFGQVEIRFVRGHIEGHNKTELPVRQGNGVICHCFIGRVRRIVVVHFPGVLLLHMVLRIANHHFLVDAAGINRRACFGVVVDMKLKIERNTCRVIRSCLIARADCGKAC